MGGVTKTLEAEWIRPAVVAVGRMLPPARSCQRPAWGDDEPPRLSFCPTPAGICLARLRTFGQTGLIPRQTPSVLALQVPGGMFPYPQAEQAPASRW